MKKNKLAIFDLDGTLFDTRDVNFRAYKNALEVCGYQSKFDYIFYCSFCNGKSYKTFLPKLIPEITEVKMDEIHNCKKELYNKYLHLAVKNLHLFYIIEMLRKQYLIALATTASSQNTEDILKKFDALHYFDFIIAQEDVIEEKPNPECFIKAMSMAGVDCKDTIVFEDSEVGLQAAAASGANYMRVYGFS